MEVCNLEVPGVVTSAPGKIILEIENNNKKKSPIFNFILISLLRSSQKAAGFHETI